MTTRRKINEPITDNKEKAFRENVREREGEREGSPSRAHRNKEGTSEKKTGTAPKTGKKFPR